MAHQHDFAMAGEVVQAGNANAADFRISVQGMGNNQLLSDAVTLANADTIWYAAIGEKGAYEVGVGVYASATTTLTRSSANVVESSNSDSAVSFTGPVKVHWIGGIDDGTAATAANADKARQAAAAIA